MAYCAVFSCFVTCCLAISTQAAVGSVEVGLFKSCVFFVDIQALDRLWQGDLLFHRHPMHCHSWSLSSGKGNDVVVAVAAVDGQSHGGTDNVGTMKGFLKRHILGLADADSAILLPVA